MAIKVDLNTRAIVQKFDGKFDSNVLPVLTEQIAYDANQYAKVRSHALEMSMPLHSDFTHGIIKWVTPYAARQFWEIQTAHTDVNPNASWKWFFVAKGKHLAQWVEMAKRLMRGDQTKGGSR